jgi:endonuclease/exonuclease/phosphatase family metal-dependent hydrolase
MCELVRRDAANATRHGLPFIVALIWLTACVGQPIDMQDMDAGPSPDLADAAPPAAAYMAAPPDTCVPDPTSTMPPLVCPHFTHCEPNAVAPARMRVVTWNIKVGSQRGLDKIIDTLRALNADIILLQEVDSDVERTGHVDQPRVIAEALGLAYIFAPTLNLEGGTYGIAMLSRLPFASAARIPLSNDDAAEVRTALAVDVCVGARQWRVINHHADYELAGAQRSVVEVLQALAAQRGSRTIFAGDFNQPPSERGPRACPLAGLVDAVAPFDTHATWGSERIDYVFVDRTIVDRVVDAEVIVVGKASDHNAVIVDLLTQ